MGLQTTHSNMVSRLMKNPEVIHGQLTVPDCDLIHQAFGICGEAGEILDAVKKAVIYREALDRGNIVEELGDMEFFMESLRQRLGVSREECLSTNIAKLHLRYPGGYGDDMAAKRMDKI